MTEADDQLRAEGIPADRSRISNALFDGGRLIATVRSRRTRRHVTVRLTAKKREGEGWVSRARIEGRVGIDEASAIFADDPTEVWPDGRLGTFWTETGEWKPARDAEPNRCWAAFAVLRYGLGMLDLEEDAEVFLAAECSYCGKPLTDPESVKRGTGPECFGRSTRSRVAERLEV